MYYYSYFYRCSKLRHNEKETQTEDSETSYEITKPPVGAVLTEIPEDAKEDMIDEDTLYIHNDIFYKKVILETGETAYKIVYYSANSNS